MRCGQVEMKWGEVWSCEIRLRWSGVRCGHVRLG